MKDRIPTHKKGSKSLGSLLRYMEGIEMIIELKNGKRHRGILTTADEYMNLTLEKAEDDVKTDTPPMTVVNKQDYSSAAAGRSVNTTSILETNIFGSLDIRGSNIRYIHFPDNADMTSIVKVGVERERNATKKYNRGKRKK